MPRMIVLEAAHITEAVRIFGWLDEWFCECVWWLGEWFRECVGALMNNFVDAWVAGRICK